MAKQAYIFIGRSGCGKGTQVKLLINELIKQKRTIFNLETGDKFREFIKKGTYSSNLSRVIGEKGGLQPEFLAVLMWANSMTESAVGDEDFVLDGAPRKLLEAKILDSALKFYKFVKPIVVFVNVSRQWSEKRLSERGRDDDAVQEIKRRLDWYETDVEPVLGWYRSNPDYLFLDINGEQTIEEVHQEIINKIG